MTWLSKLLQNLRNIKLLLRRIHSFARIARFSRQRPYAEYGVLREISELALSHKLKGMEGIYDVREEIPEKREALNRWAEFIVNCGKTTFIYRWEAYA